MIVLAWLVLLGLFALGTLLGRRLGLLPIVSQLLLAICGLPLLLQGVQPLQLQAADLLAPDWLQGAYAVAFSLLLGHILSDVVELRLQPGSVQIALPSFFLPFFCGLACALWLLPALDALACVAVGLLFALTAIPVLFLYLQHLNYPALRVRQLMQAAILMDLLCWLIFALAKGVSAPHSLLWPLLAGCLPLLCRVMHWHSARFNGLCFFVVLLVLQWLGSNPLLFGILYLLLLAALRQPLALPLPSHWLGALQTWLLVPLILAYGLLQVDWSQAWQGYDAWQFAALLGLPILSKLAGNWLGLSWAEGRLGWRAGKWRESLLLNTRGLTEIIFLNLLFQQHLIGAPLYCALMLMGLIATLLPAMTGGYVNTHNEARSRHEVS